MTPDIKPILEKLADHIHLTTLSCMGGPNAYRNYQIARAEYIDKALSDIDAAYRKLSPDMEEKCSHSDNVTVFHCACCSNAVKDV